MKRSGESFMTYGQELKRLVNKAYPTLPQIALDQQVLDQFISGITNPEIQKHVRFGHPSDLNQAISLALEMEVYHINTGDKFSKPKPAEVFAIQNENLENGQVEEIRKMRDDIMSGFAQLMNVEPSNGNGRECNYCKKWGHLKKDCFKLKAKLAREAGQNNTTDSKISTQTQPLN